MFCNYNTNNYEQSDLVIKEDLESIFVSAQVSCINTSFFHVPIRNGDSFNTNCTFQQASPGWISPHIQCRAVCLLYIQIDRRMKGLIDILYYFVYEWCMVLLFLQMSSKPSPFTPKSDQHVISPCNISPKSHT